MLRANDFSPEVTFFIQDEGIFCETPVNELFSKTTLVIPKEIFIEAYNKWIRENEIPKEIFIEAYNKWIRGNEDD